jgi:hypothetical protein
MDPPALIVALDGDLGGGVVLEARPDGVVGVALDDGSCGSWGDLESATTEASASCLWLFHQAMLGQDVPLLRQPVIVVTVHATTNNV